VVAGWRHVRWLSMCTGVVLLTAFAPAWGFDLDGDIDFYPFPTYNNSRNEGNTYGGVLVFLVVNKKHEIEHVIASLIQYNDFTGWEGGLIAFGDPSDHQEYKVVFDWSQEIDREIRLAYDDRRFWDGKYDIGFKFEYDRQGTNRFFGLGPESSQSNETNYGDEDLQASAHWGLNLTDHLTVGLGERYRSQSISQGSVASVPFLDDHFPGVRGVHGLGLVGTNIYLTFDTRDNAETPREGEYYSASVDGVTGISNDTPSAYQRYSFEGKKYIPFGDDRQFVLVVRGRLEFQSGPQAPFNDQSSLGGESTLRAFGDDRFIDRHFWLINVEQRIRIWRTSLWDYPIELEAAPFVDIGSVYSSFDNIAQDVQVNPGFAVRLLSRPNVVGGMSVSWGADGMLVVGGFSFPF